MNLRYISFRFPGYFLEQKITLRYKRFTDKNSQVSRLDNFADEFIRAVKQKKNPSICGLDPLVSSLPPKIKDRHRHLNSPEGVADAILEFNMDIIDAVCDIVPAVKPQMAYYEKYGIPGLRAFQQTVSYARSKGLVVIEDAKRNDIGRTAQQYADGHIGEVGLLDETSIPMFDVDCMTVNAYLGSDGVKPFLGYCGNGKGIFVLDKTSNDSSSELQDRLVLLTMDESLRIDERLRGKGLGLDDLPAFKNYENMIARIRSNEADVAPLYVVMARLIDKWGSAPEFVGENGYSSVGAVVGATYPEEAKVLRELMPHAILLGPGYRTQGGTGEDAANLFNDDGFGAGVNNSSGMTFAYQKKPFSAFYGPNEFADAARIAAQRMKEDIVGALQKAGKWDL